MRAQLVDMAVWAQSQAVAAQTTKLNKLRGQPPTGADRAALSRARTA